MSYGYKNKNKNKRYSSFINLKYYMINYELNINN